MKTKIKILSILLTLVVFLSGCGVWFTNDIGGQNGLIIGTTDTWVETLKDIPPFSDEPYVIINDNKPNFTDDMLSDKAYEFYSELDDLGRCGYTIACVGPEIMPTEERGEIGMVKPTGWHTVKYDNVDGKYLYNRCHLIGYQLTGENANKRNLITGTRYLNMDGMLPFENLIAEYVEETNNHVLYRVTPIFEGDNLLASGVLLEAYSVEDGGEGICFNVFLYNVQPKVILDYSTGASEAENPEDEAVPECDYIVNMSKTSKKIHTPDCHNANAISEKNKWYYIGNIEDLEADGYTRAGCCNPK